MKDIRILFNHKTGNFEIIKPFKGDRVVVKILEQASLVIQDIALLEQTDISVSNIFSRGRKREVVSIRHILAYLFWEYCVSEKRHDLFKNHYKISGYIIAGIIGGRDHSTLNHACKLVTGSKKKQHKINHLKDLSIFDLFVLKYEKKFRDCFEIELCREEKVKDSKVFLSTLTMADLSNLFSHNNIDISNIAITEPFKEYFQKAYGVP